MAAAERTPEERIRAFTDAVDEEILIPTRRYLRGLRRGIMLGLVVGWLCAPAPGRETRARLESTWRRLRRLLP